MFERVGRPVDPDWLVRQAVAIWLLAVAAQCAGALAAGILALKWLVTALWSLLQALLGLWLGIPLPDLHLLATEVVAEPEEIVAVSLDGGWEELREGWGHDGGLEALPDRPLPSLAPEPTPEVARRDAIVEEVEAAGMLMLLGTLGSAEGRIEDLFGDGLDDSLGALSGGLSGTATSALIGADEHDEVGGLIGGLGLTGTGTGGGGEGTMGLGGLGAGEPGGVVGGIGFGTGGMVERARPRLVRRAEVVWPDDEGAHRCTVEVRVDAGGRGTVARFVRCDEAYRALVEAAVSASTFAPAEGPDGPAEGTLVVAWP